MLRRLVATSGTWTTIPLRLALAVIFFAHGSQKVLGSYGGKGFATWTAGQTPFSFMRPTWLWLGAAALSELIGSLLVFIGLFTRFGSFLIACVMLTAIAGLHWPIFFARDNGIEYPLSLLAISLALIIAGGGQLSVDRALTGSSGRRK